MSYSIRLKAKERDELESRMLNSKEIRIYNRLLAIKLKSQRMKNQDIAKALNVSTATITNWFKLFIDEGFIGLCQKNYPKRESKLDRVKQELHDYLVKHNASSPEIQQYLKENHDIHLCQNAIINYIKKEFNYSFKKQG